MNLGGLVPVDRFEIPCSFAKISLPFLKIPCGLGSHRKAESSPHWEGRLRSATACTRGHPAIHQRDPSVTVTARMVSTEPGAGGQGAGVAALGTAVGVPLWVVFGAGATFLGVLYEEITRKKPNKSTSYQVIDAEREDKENVTNLSSRRGSVLTLHEAEVSASSALHDVKFWDLGRVGDLIKCGLPNDSRLNYCGVYKLTVSPGYVPRFIHPDKTRAAKNVIKPWDVERLKSKWVLKTDIVYIGLAGSRTPMSLRKRLDELLKHASGLTTDRGPHKGGEIVWQLRDYHQFHLWAAQTDDPPIPREIEETLLRQFAEAHGTLPFANRQS
jgi:hypothetical protein